MTKTFTIEKKQIESYKIRNTDGGFAWADITIDDSGGKNAGRIQIASDYGQWQNYWGACGTPFKKFLGQLDIHYAAGKFGTGNHFDHDATIKNLENRVDEYSEDYPELKSVLLEELDVLRDAYNMNEFEAQMWNCDNILSMEGHQPDIIKCVEPGFRRFWEEIWPSFIEHSNTEDE